jgi:hypothetical protein
MATKYIVDNLSGQTINGDLTINGNLTTTNLNNSGTYRALLTQTGSLNGDSIYFNNRLIIGETYEITDYQDYDDFSNVADVQSGAALLDFDYDWSPVVGINGQFGGLTGTTSGSGSGASFDGYWCGTTNPIIINITIDNGGDGYVVGDTITILGTELSGSTPTNDLTITVTEVDTNINVTGCIFIATGDTPIIWGNTILTSVGDLVVDVLENTLGDELEWLYDPLFQEGLYLVSFSEYINNNNVCYIFPRNKTQITTPSFIAPFNYDFYSPPQFNLIVSSQIGYFLGPIDDTIFLSVYDVGTSSFSGNSLYYTPIEIKLNSSITQEDTPLTSINWSTYSGDSDFDTYDIVFPPILNVTRLTIGKCGDATAHVHSDYEYSDLTIQLFDNEDWVTVWSYTLNNPNYDFDDSPDLYFPGNIDVTFANITSVSGIRVTSDPGQEQTYHDFDGLTFNFFN